MNMPLKPKVSRRTLILHFVAIFLAIVGIITLAFGYYTYQRFQLHQDSQQHAESLRLNLASKIIARNLQQLVIDLRLLTESQHLREYLDNPGPQNTVRLQNDFINLSMQTRVYDQIRYIDRQGHERIRINYNNGDPRIVANEKLQDKSDRYYFRDTIQLTTDQIYMSPLDLNVENGKLELPYKPVIRVATPLKHPQHSQLDGVLVLNYLASRLLVRFEEIMTESWGSPMLLNPEGFWIYSARHEDEWGFMLGNNSSFATRYPLAWSAMQNTPSGAVNTVEGLFTYLKLSPNQFAGVPGNARTEPMAWWLVSHVAPEQLSYSLWKETQTHPVMSLLILLMSMSLSGTLAWLRANNIEKTHSLTISRARYRNLFENMAEGYALQEAVYDSAGNVHDFRYLEINPAFERILGLRREEVIGKTISALLPDVEAYWLEIFTRVATTGKAARLEQYSGSFDRYFEIIAASPDQGLVAILFSDVSERKRAEETQRQAATVFNNTMEAIMITDAEERIVMVNQAYTKITGYTAEEVIGKTPRTHHSGKHDKTFYRLLWDKLLANGQWQGEIWNLRKNGEDFPAWENISVVRNEQGEITNYVSVFSDISSIKLTEARLSQLAHQDYLTGLANRMAFNLNLEKALERAQRHRHKVALLFLDLDRFKLINDTLGHEAGDQMLKIIGQRLRQSVRAEDMVARLGGDEFTIVLEEIMNNDGAAGFARKVIRAVAEPLQIKDQEIVITTSIGLSIYPDDATTATDLAKAADTAMYRAKARGRNTFEFYTSELTDNALQHLSTENSLRQALARDELQLFYQPQLEVATGSLCGVEALLRWNHPELGLLLPDQFIKIAEESQLIDLIGNWVIRTVCAQVRDWRNAGLPKLRIAINLSPRQIMYDSTVDTLQQALTQYNLSTEDLLIELEITEHVLQSYEQISEPLRRLRKLGVRIAIDDFGTGYSSLSHLTQLPIDTLKIDRLFLRDIPKDAHNTAITSAIISMGHSLGMRVIAEGIENHEQWQFLQQHACDEAQGFLFSAAVPPAQLLDMLREGRLATMPAAFYDK
ncbi:MAG: EAL domain-containing protein [Gammaproteobacteria bacterium]|nr:EAL domain-containing protein [Gammaproteobacteria bacterium]